MAFAFGLSAEIDKPLQKTEVEDYLWSEFHWVDKKTVYFFIFLSVHFKCFLKFLF